MKSLKLLVTLLAMSSLNSFAVCDGSSKGMNNQIYSQLEEISCNRIIDNNGTVGLSEDATICIEKYTRIEANKHGKMFEVFVSGKLNDNIYIDEDNKSSEISELQMSYFSDDGFRGLSVGKGIMKNRLEMHIHRNSSYLSVTKKGGLIETAVDALFACHRKTIKM